MGGPQPQDIGAPPLRILTLGRFEVWQGPQRVDPRALHRRRAGELLALLLLHPYRSLTFDQIADALCPERNGDAARVFFHHATSSLRQALEPSLPEKRPSRHLAVSEGRVALTLPADSWVDFEAFEGHCRRGEWEAAVRAYGGPLLPEFLYADWSQAPRQRLVQRYQQALLQVARQELGAGRAADALEACRLVLELEPAHEEAAYLGMRASLALGDRTGALRLYQAVARALREDFGAEPDDELQALFRKAVART